MPQDSRLVDVATQGLGHALALASEHDAKGEHGHEEHVHGFIVILFFFMSLVLGASTMYLIGRYAPNLPYTCVLLVEGFILGLAHKSETLPLGTLGQSIDMWVKIDPHLLLYSFLPALLFGDSMSLNWHLIKKCFGQCLVLACPGVLLGAFATAAVGKYVFPYGWGWYMSLTFGSILAATDPVAVVAILNELGASPKLTMVVSGESLMNDGTAIVLFNMFRALTLCEAASSEGSGLENIDKRKLLNSIGVPEDKSYPDAMCIVKYFLRMSLGGVLLGSLFGYLAVTCIGIIRRAGTHSDSTLQIIVSLCCAYLAFFFGEFYCGVSGVLATVAAAVVFGAFGWPQFVSSASLHDVWHTIEHIGNTLIFMLSGLILGEQLIERSDDINGADGLYLLLLFILVILIRFAMVFCFFPLISRMGYGFSQKEAIMLSWGGLRGAVGLALAMDIDHVYFQARESRIHCEQIHGCSDLDAGLICEVQCGDITQFSRRGSRVMFHVGGIAVMTLLFNGGTSKMLLTFLGMTKSTFAKEALDKDITRRISSYCRKVFDEQIEKVGKAEFTRAQRNEVRQMCSILRSVHFEVQGSESFSRRPADNDMATVVRELFYAALRTAYMEQIETGVLPKTGAQTAILFESLEVAMDYVDSGLKDGDVVLEACHRKDRSFVIWLINHFWDSTPRWTALDMFLINAGIVASKPLECYMLKCFVEAHRKAQQTVLMLTGDTEGIDTIEEQTVVQESENAIAKAQAELDAMAQELKTSVTTQQVASAVLEKQKQFISKLVHDGMLEDKEAHHMMERVHKDLHCVANARRGLRNPVATRHSVRHSSVPQVDTGVISFSKSARVTCTRSSTGPLAIHPPELREARELEMCETRDASRPSCLRKSRTDIPHL